MDNLLGRLAALCLGGVLSCSVGEDIGESGEKDIQSPTANYVLNGTVVSEKDTTRRIPGLQVVISHASPHPAADTCFTGENGDFVWNNPITTFGKDLVLSISVTDIDGDENQSYLPYTTTLSFSREEIGEDIAGFLGAGQKELLIRMKEGRE
jgi:putative lipoprotein (rSAM/lipoprotein system)